MSNYIGSGAVTVLAACGPWCCSLHVATAAESMRSCLLHVRRHMPPLQFIYVRRHAPRVLTELSATAGANADADSDADAVCCCEPGQIC